MKSMLKGTYHLKKSNLLRMKKKKAASVEEFEQKALEKLGGSIAFVTKSQMLWEGDKVETAKP